MSALAGRSSTPTHALVGNTFALIFRSFQPHNHPHGTHGPWSPCPTAMSLFALAVVQAGFGAIGQMSRGRA
ncbi:hypothetical protein Micbo1qcDRAFT_158693 [Microdochium bolleyi]|uniref:Uncharacterized protein n=1 Tax=Microdochium bolleyi TaxID=196109 RepID=A0A136J9F6_9PEZI|nr:hypothetical protein Micbo1qcDRAFT_158693 [Microdochium bolleyi]